MTKRKRTAKSGGKRTKKRKTLEGSFNFCAIAVNTEGHILKENGIYGRVDATGCLLEPSKVCYESGKNGSGTIVEVREAPMARIPYREESYYRDRIIHRRNQENDMRNQVNRRRDQEDGDDLSMLSTENPVTLSYVVREEIVDGLVYHSCYNAFRVREGKEQEEWGYLAF